jgi:hypothetical protein
LTKCATGKTAQTNASMASCSVPNTFQAGRIKVPQKQSVPRQHATRS